MAKAPATRGATTRGPGLREVVYRLTPKPGHAPTGLSLHLSQVAPEATIETTVTHLDDSGLVWRTLNVHGPRAAVDAVAKAFDRYRSPHLVEKEVLGRTPQRAILWYKYRADKVKGLSHTHLAFQLLGRDTVITDHARAGVLTLRVLARAGKGLQEFLRRIRAPQEGLATEVLYTGPPKEAAFVSLSSVQEDALRLARDMGYFDVPPKAGVRDVAKALGIPATTASYRLRTAESRLVAAHLET